MTDFESCLEIEMDRLSNRWVAGDFSVEFTINPVGIVTRALLHAGHRGKCGELRQQRGVERGITAGTGLGHVLGD